MIHHAGLIATRLGERWRGALIEGPSGSGKSDLALRMLARGYRLVADDRTELWTADGRLFGRAPDALAGLIEVRGQGIEPVMALPLAEVVLLVRCGAPERMPEPQSAELLGISLPVVTIAALEASAAAKLSRALARFDGSVNRRM